MNSAIKKTLISSSLAFAITLLTLFIVTGSKSVGPSCDICEDISPGYTKRGFPIAYLKTTTSQGGEQEIEYILPEAIVLNVIFWFIPSLLIVNFLIRKRKS